METIVIESFMAVQIKEIVSQTANKLHTKNCYKVVSKGYNSVEDAVEEKNKYSNPEHYIVVKYWF